MRKHLKSKRCYKLQIGENIRLWRQVKTIKQGELARRLGISAAAVSQIENNQTEITIHRIEDIAEVLNIRPEQLFKSPNDEALDKFFSSSKQGDERLLLSEILVLMEGMHNLLLNSKREN